MSETPRTIIVKITIVWFEWNINIFLEKLNIKRNFSRLTKAINAESAMGTSESQQLER